MYSKLPGNEMVDKLIEIENKRIEALKSYAILDTGPEQDYDEITALVAQISGAPMVLISFVDEKRHWVKSSFGITISEIPKEGSFCSIAINSSDEPLIIADALSDPLFAASPFLLNNERVSFYVGIPLVDSNNIVLGTLSIMAFKTREISSKSLKSLQTIAKGIVRLLELRKINEHSFVEREKISAALELNNSFYLILNSNFEITAIGKSFIKSNLEIAIQNKITDFFNLEFDIIAAIESRISGKSKVLFFSSKSKEQRFKCSVSKLNSDIIISAQPILNGTFSFKNYNITLNDFSQHDAIIEYLFLQQSAQKSLNEARSLVDAVQKKNSELKEQKKQIEQNEQFLKANLVETEKTEERYRNLINTTNDLILSIDKSGTIFFVNDSWLKKMDYSKSDVIGNSIFKHVHPDSQEHCIEFFQDLMTNSHPELYVNYSLISRKGEKIEVEGTIIVKYEQNEFLEVNSFLKDITEINKLKRIEEDKTKEILASKEKIEVLMGSLSETVWGMSLPDYTLQYVSESAAQLYEVPVEEWYSNLNLWSDAIHPEDKEWVLKESENLFITGQTNLEYRIVTPANKTKWIYSKTKIIKNESGIPVLMTGISSDVTSRKLTEQRLLNYKQAIDESAIVSITDTEGIITYVNDKFCEISKYSREELIGQNHRIVNSGFHSKDFFDKMWNTISSGNVWKDEKKNKTKQGEEYFIEAAIVPFMNEGKPFQYISIGYESTEKVKRKSEIESQKVFYESILNNIPIDIAVFDENHKYVFVNKEAIKDEKIRKWIIGKDDFDYAKLKNLSTEFAQKRRDIFMKILHSVEEHLWLDEQISAAGETKYKERRFYILEDKKNVIGYGVDVTVFKEQEILLSTSLEQKEALLGEVHHRVKNNLALVIGLIEMQQISTASSYVTSQLSEIRNRITTMSLIHEKLYKSANFAKIDLKDYLEDLVRFLNGYYSKGKEITLNFELEQIFAITDKAIPIALIVNELITNSFKYAFEHEKGGIITIKLKEMDSEIHLIVSDNGPGLPDNLNLKKADSFGYKLLNIFVKQIKGSYEYENNQGLSIKIKFKND